MVDNDEATDDEEKDEGGCTTAPAPDDVNDEDCTLVDRADRGGLSEPSQGLLRGPCR